MVKTSVRIGAVWDRTTAFLGDHLGSIAPIAILTIFLPSSLSGALETATTAPHLAWVMALASLALLIVTLLGQLALTSLVFDPAAGVGAIGRALPRLLPALGIFILVAIALSLLIVPVPLILLAYGMDPLATTTMTADTMPPGAGGPLLLYAIFLIGALLWATARLMVTTPVIVAERRGLGALARSFRLTRGLTWKLIGVLLLYIVVVGIATLAAQGVFGAIFALVASGEGGELGVARVLTAIMVSVVTTIFTVVQALFVAQLYAAISAGEPVVEAVWDRPVDPV